MIEESGRPGLELQKVVTIDGDDYKVHLLPPSKSFKMSTKLMKMIGEPIGAMAGASGDEERAAKMMPAAIRALTDRLDSDDALQLVKDLISTCTYQNKNINFELHFHGRMGHLLKLVSKVVEVQFQDFFGEIRQSVSVLMEKVG